MTVEILYPEVCGLYGDAQNARYLELTLPEAEFIYTDLNTEPYFVNNDPDIILIGSMSEEMQRRVLGIFSPLKNRINALIEKGTVILATGNAAELFCEKIEYVTEKTEAEALGIFPPTVKTDLFKRYNGKVLGACDGIKIVGFRSQFSLAQVEELEETTAELHQMCLKVVEKVIASDELMTKLDRKSVV
mgnify:CR=1 FL=1